MKRWKSDLGLEARMFITMLLLAVIYLAFLAFLLTMNTSQVVIILFMGGFMFLQYFFSDKMILGSMGAKMVSESEAPELYQIVSRLCAIADLPMPKIAIVNTTMPNAFATGRNQKNAVVAVTTGIMNQLNRSELEAVLAHELTHVKNRDMMVMTIATFLSSVAQLLVRWLPFFGSGNQRDRNGSGSFILIFLVSLVVWIVSYILIMALSRYREFAADRGSAIITGQPSNLASALMKISGHRVPTQDLRKVETRKGAVHSACHLRLAHLEPVLHPSLDRCQDCCPGTHREGAGGLKWASWTQSWERPSFPRPRLTSSSPYPQRQ